MLTVEGGTAADTLYSMARRTAGGPARPEHQPIRARPASDLPSAVPSRQASEASERLRFLPADWLPLTLIAVDAAIVVAAVLVSYWYRVNLDFINARDQTALHFAPYLAALPAVVAIYLFALTLNKQYQSWRGRTLVDLVLQLYSGIGLAAILMLSAIAFFNLGLYYSRLTITYTVLLTAVV